MSLKILSHLFTGPFPPDNAKVRPNQNPVVFAIVCRGGEPWNPEFTLIYIDKSGAEGLIIKDLPEHTKWCNECDGDIGVYFLPFPKLRSPETDPRDSVIEEIRAALKPPGGQIPIHGMM